MVSQLKPATIVLNAGLWRHFEREPWTLERADAILAAAAEAVAPQGGRVVWKTTTHSLDTRFPVGRNFDDLQLAAAAKVGGGVMDFW